MLIRAYLRASTKEQNAERARESLIQFAAQHGQLIAAFYIENVSGATLHRPELMRLIAESGEGDIVLVEQIDRLARLKQSDWDTLKQKLASKRLAIVSPELPTSWLALQQHSETDFTGAILQAVNAMMLDMLAAVARKDYDDRRRRQSQGIAKAKVDGKYNGRQPDLKRHQHIASLLKTGHSYSDIQDMLGCSRHLIATISKNIGCTEQ
ncbi:recombinase family protein [Shewanella oncorhynchi]|uniref:recombinase family protein n=1 Tax=Gammaproteobacteria TaxID=1236 RepID=UPI0021DAB51A|nr:MULTISPECIES: recombinase family protein [Gammaproteobacteria]MCU8013574.1 recombinase family protein [Shewanella sp. SM74]MCU8040793.1 recombinase family protein [Shewanella sp. SM69]MCU8105768.1 recombinase family protein [Shewanella sp. SM101]WAL78970.1 recombinase family protein [Shewanella sp. DAU305]